jgi:hypothetical protein
MEVRGLPTSTYSNPYAISCIAPGDCVAAGEVASMGSAQTQSFMMVQSNGSWKPPILIATGGIDAIGDVSDLGVQVVSCSTIGYCALGGTTGAGLAFVDDKVQNSGP